MNAEILMGGEIFKHLVGNIANAHLQGSAIFDQGSYVFSDLRDGAIHLTGIIHFRQSAFMLYQHINFINMNKSIAMGTRHLRVYLGDDYFGGIHGGAGNINRSTKGTEAMPV